jgi:hypothetical protein
VHLRARNRNWKLKLILAAGFALSAFTAIALSASPASAQSGGVSADGSGTESGSGDGTTTRTTSGRKAKLRNGLAIPPRSAPRRVRRVIEAANEIAKGKGYCYGGGHRSFKSSCYDCSGAVSYALKGGNFVKSPMPSSGYFRWGKRGRGKWITVFTSSGHMYMKVAGLRFDTSMTPGTGPSWSDQMRSGNGFRKRHKPRF